MACAFAPALPPSELPSVVLLFHFAPAGLRGSALAMALSKSGEEVRAALEDLTGQKAPLTSDDAPDRAAELLQPGSSGLGYSQLNEILVLLGYDRITHSFFQYLVDGKSSYRSGSALTSVGELRSGVDRFRQVALLLFGNVKFGFKTLSADAELLRRWLSTLEPIDEQSFHDRHDQVQPLVDIPGEDTFFLGYIVQRDLAERLGKNPKDTEAQAAETKRKDIVDRGIRNHEVYLASDHLDVYVATSMRERHEYTEVNRFTRSIFSHPILKSLKIRWFDPTQAYCTDRIDKGLSEALMLKRARCTLYFAQETDTLGKDSELACTLAQGKPVIAFIPEATPEYVRDLLEGLSRLYPEKSEIDLILNHLRIFDPVAAWKDATVRSWLDDPASASLGDARQRLTDTISQHYDRRAALLRESHPLGIQVHLDTGVANGVLVVRTPDKCASIISRVLTRRLEFDLEKKEQDGRKYLFLRERESRCIFRVMTGDTLLTNAFWNFYLDPVD